MIRRALSLFPSIFYLLPVYFLASLLFTYPLIVTAGSAVTDPVDPILNTWILAWVQHALLSQPLELLDANIFYPYERTLLYSETLLLPSVILLPVKVATGNSILVCNLFVLLGFTSTAGSGYLLGRWLFRGHWPGLLLGSVLAFNSYTLSNISQAQLLHLEWLPLALIYLGKLLHRPRLRFGLLFALFLAAQFYTVVYYGLFSFVVVGIAGGSAWLLKAFPSPQVRWRTLALLLGGTVMALLPCLPLALPYYYLSQERGFARVWTDTWPFSASLEMWLTAPAQNFLYGGRIGDELPKVGFYAVDALFPGVLLLLTAVSGLLLWSWHAIGIRESSQGPDVDRVAARYPLFLLLGIGLFFLLSLGPYPQIKSLQPNFDQVLPYAWIHQWVPGFVALRAPVRFALLVFLGLGIASGYLLAHLRWRSLQAFLLILLLIENVPVPANGLYTPSIGPQRRALYSWLAAQEDTVYLELPAYSYEQGGTADRWLESQFASTLHWQSTPVGHSGFFPPHHNDLLLFVSEFPKSEAVRFLQALGVEWLLLYRDRLPQPQWQAIQAHVQAQGWETQPWGDIWTVRLPKIDAALPAQTYFIPERAQAGERLMLSAIFTSTTPVPILPDTDLGKVRAEWWQAEQRILVAQASYQPPFFVDSVAVSDVSIPVPAVSGSYHLRVYGAQLSQPLAAADITVVADDAPPEIVLLPVVGEQAVLACEGEQTQIRVHMRTVGWYERPFTLSARLLDRNEREAARSAVDVEFPAHRPRTTLLTTHAYTLPLAVALPVDLDSPVVEVSAYQWQQEAERIVRRYFVTDDGAVVQTLRLPLAGFSPCR